MGRVVVLGASLIDMNLRLDRLPAPGETRLGSNFFTSTGGKGANQAVAARRAGAQVTFLSAFGDDDLGRQMQERYEAEGIDVRQVLTVPGEASGVALIMVGDDGENLIGVSMGANARLTPQYIHDLEVEVFEGPGILLVSLEVPIDTAIAAIQRARHSGMKVIVNPAPARRELVEGDLLGSIDVLTPNTAEIRELAGRPPQDEHEAAWRASDDLLDRGLGCIVSTLGSSGCSIYPASADGGERGVPKIIPPFPVEAVDTVGAGDAFNGALAAALADGLSLVEAATRANAAGAIAVTKPGAQGALPTRQEIDRMMATLDPV